MYRCRYKLCFYASHSAYGVHQHERRCKLKNSQAGRGRPYSLSTTTSNQPISSNLNDEPMVDLDGTNEITVCESIRNENSELQAITDICRDGDSYNDENVTRFSEVSSFLLRLKEKVGTKVLNSLLSFLQREDFDLVTFNKLFPSADAIRRFQDKLVSIHAENSGFNKHQMSGRNNNIHGVLYQRDPVIVLRRQFEKVKSVDTFFRPVQMNNKEGERIYYHPCHTDFAEEVYRYVRRKVMSSKKDSVFWNEHNSSIPISFVAFLQLYTDKTVTSLSTNATSAHPIHLLPLNIALHDRQRLIDCGDTIVGFLPVHHDVPLEDSSYHKQDVPSTSRHDSRRFRMDLLHMSIEYILEQLYEYAEDGFLTRHDDNQSRVCFPVLVSCCCDIPKMGDLSRLRSFPSKRCCPRCFSVVNHHTDFKVGKTRVVYDMKEVLMKAENLMKSSETKKEAEELLKEYSLHSWPSFLQTCPLVPSGCSLDMYRLFTFESLHNLHLGVSKLIKTCAMKRLESSTLFTKEKDSADSKPYSAIRHSILAGANSVLSAIERDSPESNFHIDFSMNEVTSTLNGIFTKDGMRGMLEGKDYRNLDKVFPFIGGYMDR